MPFRPNRVFKELSRLFCSYCFYFYFIHFFFFEKRENEKPRINRRNWVQMKNFDDLSNSFRILLAFILLFQVNQVLAKDWMENRLSYFEKKGNPLSLRVSVLSCFSVGSKSSNINFSFSLFGSSLFRYWVSLSLNSGHMESWVWLFHLLCPCHTLYSNFTQFTRIGRDFRWTFRCTRCLSLNFTVDRIVTEYSTLKVLCLISVQTRWKR